MVAALLGTTSPPTFVALSRINVVRLGLIGYLIKGKKKKKQKGLRPFDYLELKYILLKLLRDCRGHLVK